LKKSEKKLEKELKERRKVVVILGPTSSGKSELAVNLALSFNGEVVSADSRQVYRGLDISSSKVPGSWERSGRKRFFVYKDVRHHMIDLVPLRKQYSAGQYRKKAKRAINDILERERLPIVAGGTGFYINALIHDLELPKVKPNRKLRNELENLSTDQLVHRLKALDPRRAEEIDTKNRRRLVRAIEVVVLTKSQVQPLEHDHSNDPYHSLRIGLKPSDEELKRRISAVVHERIKNGVVDEIRRTHRRGIGWDRIYDLGLEYKFIADHIKGPVNLEEMAELIRKEYWHYVKRQMTWFKRDNDIIWIDAPEKAFPLVEDFLGLEASPSPDRLEI